MSSATGPKPLDAATKERRRQAWQRRMAGVEGLVHKALRGNPDPLIAYIDGGGPLQLSENDRQWLAYLLEQKLPRIGRPPGSLTPKNEAIRCASYLVRIGKRWWRRKHGRKRVPEEILERLSNRAIELVEPEFPSARGKISTRAVIEESHSKRCEEMWEAEFLNELKEEIIELAQR